MNKQVKQLGNVFEDLFNYKVSRVRLSTMIERLPQVQVNHYITNFVFYEDSPATLLIIYYAGHGSPGNTPGGLELSRFVKNAYSTRTPANYAVLDSLPLTIRNPLYGIMRKATCRLREPTSSRSSIVATLVIWEEAAALVRDTSNFLGQPLRDQRLKVLGNVPLPLVSFGLSKNLRRIMTNSRLLN